MGHSKLDSHRNLVSLPLKRRKLYAKNDLEKDYS